MRGLKFIALLLALTALQLAGCKKDEEPTTDYPIWLLNVEVMQSPDGVNLTPVDGCPQMVWAYSQDTGEGTTVGCYRGTNECKAFEHIEDRVTIRYYITCDGYFNSEAGIATFRPEDAVQRPGREGPEVRYDARVVLLREEG